MDETGETADRDPPWRQSLRRFFSRPIVDVIVGLLVLVSVVLTLVELWLESRLNAGRFPLLFGFGPLQHNQLIWMVFISDLITAFFAIELTLRYLGAISKREFLSEYWTDILATLPLFRVFRSIRALRLLRLVRLFRLLGVMSRLSSHDMLTELKTSKNAILVAVFWSRFIPMAARSL